MNLEAMELLPNTMLGFTLSMPEEHYTPVTGNIVETFWVRINEAFRLSVFYGRYKLPNGQQSALHKECECCYYVALRSYPSKWAYWHSDPGFNNDVVFRRAYAESLLVAKCIMFAWIEEVTSGGTIVVEHFARNC